MKEVPKYRLGAAVAIPRQKVLAHFQAYIERPLANGPAGGYQLRDGSWLLLKSQGPEEAVLVEVHCVLHVNPTTRAVTCEAKNWLLALCQEMGLELQTRPANVRMPASEGALMSDFFHSGAFRQARHQAAHPTDRPGEKPPRSA